MEGFTSRLPVTPDWKTTIAGRLVFISLILMTSLIRSRGPLPVMKNEPFSGRAGVRASALHSQDSFQIGSGNAPTGRSWYTETKPMNIVCGPYVCVKPGLHDLRHALWLSREEKGSPPLRLIHYYIREESIIIIIRCSICQLLTRLSSRLMAIHTLYTMQSECQPK